MRAPLSRVDSGLAETLARELESLRPDLPLIMMSGNREPAPDLLQRSLSRYLTKPVSAQHLLDAIGELTSQPACSTEVAKESQVNGEPA